MGSPSPQYSPSGRPQNCGLSQSGALITTGGKSELRRRLQPAGAIDGEPVSRDRALRSTSCMVPRHTSRLRKFSTASFS